LGDIPRKASGVPVHMQKSKVFLEQGDNWSFVTPFRRPRGVTCGCLPACASISQAKKDTLGEWNGTHSDLLLGRRCNIHKACTQRLCLVETTKEVSVVPQPRFCRTSLFLTLEKKTKSLVSLVNEQNQDWKSSTHLRKNSPKKEPSKQNMKSTRTRR